MKNKLEKIFIMNGVIWPPLLPVVTVIFSVIFCSALFFIPAAIISIIFYGYFAFEIHNIDVEKKNDGDKHPTWGKRGDNKWFIYNQYWLNALGAFVGWIALYILLFYVIRIGHYPFSVAILIWVKNLGIDDLVLVVLSFLGLTGYIPYYALLGKD